MLVTKIKKHESQSKLIARFQNQVKESGLLQEIMDRQFYLSKRAKRLAKRKRGE